MRIVSKNPYNLQGKIDWHAGVPWVPTRTPSNSTKANSVRFSILRHWFGRSLARLRWQVLHRLTAPSVVTKLQQTAAYDICQSNSMEWRASLSITQYICAHEWTNKIGKALNLEPSGWERSYHSANPLAIMHDVTLIVTQPISACRFWRQEKKNPPDLRLVPFQGTTIITVLQLNLSLACFKHQEERRGQQRQ